jgi:acyl-[acyl-carrier-protein]-phospholipid O-acyltransferase/long-chain-fatty-acid--[acyl-carrier-protein] ligase
LGVTAGMFDIPLLSFLQERSPKESRGRILAANNFLAFTSMLLASGVFGVLAGTLGLSARQIWLVAGFITVPVLLAAGYLVFTDLIRVLFRPLFWLLYRIRVEGTENLPEEGGALLVANHVTWIDAVLLTLRSPRPIRFVAYVDYVSKGVSGRIARDMKVIPIGPDRKSMVRSIRQVREALQEGDLVCVFPEGGLSRSGQIETFHPGFLSMLKGTDVPVIPIHLGGLWGSIFSYEGGKFFWKWPRRIPYPVSILFGSPIHDAPDPEQLRLAVEQLGGENHEP